jgi:small ligand-binding sensory domain FIST
LGLWLLIGILGLGQPTGQAAPVEFYLIERFVALGVLIHFDVEPLRSYELQSTTNFAAASGHVTAPTNAWKTVYRVDASPFANHYILPEFFTNTVSQQFYRLVVTP